jgi:hypothetical protein
MNGEERTIPEDAQVFTAKANPEILFERQQRWEQLGAAVELIRDGLGEKVDPGIRETIVALKANECSTTQSCEGHEDRGLPFPWVDVESPEVTRQKQEPKYRALSAKAKAARQGGEQMTSEESGEYHRMLVEQRILNDVERVRVQELLDEFYGAVEAKHQPERISLSNKPKIRLQPQYGIEHDDESHQAFRQKKSREEVRREITEKYLHHLPAGQAEMRKFTEFLKKKYFSE